ncbi:hypothetical protein, partial [Pseudomonas aeruginosa]|uniref:hypothetical protein n=1 Tax=Pseudomonas aeruginosa TaxID=287 RepID=UPI00207D4458
RTDKSGTTETNFQKRETETNFQKRKTETNFQKRAAVSAHHRSSQGLYQQHTYLKGKTNYVQAR